MDELKGLTEILNSPATSVASRWRRIGPLVDRELHRIASGSCCVSWPTSDSTIEPSELVSEFYLRTLGMEKTGWAKRRHIFHLRRGLHAEHPSTGTVPKAHRAGGRSPGNRPARACGAAALPPGIECRVGKLRNLNARHAMIVELRFFAGSSVSEIAAAMELSEKTVQRDWVAARAFLYSELAGDRREPRCRRPDAPNGSFLAALADPDALRALTASDSDEVRRELERLLRANRSIEQGDATGSGRRPGATVAGRYRLEYLLGSGGNGEAWLGSDLRAGERQVVLKLPHQWAWFRAELKRRFAAEAAALNRMNHPSIVPSPRLGRNGGWRPVPGDAVHRRRFASSVYRQRTVACGTRRRHL